LWRHKFLVPLQVVYHPVDRSGISAVECSDRCEAISPENGEADENRFREIPRRPVFRPPPTGADRERPVCLAQTGMA
jgi:hypothetical protein